jgi:hypothetical protein
VCATVSGLPYIREDQMRVRTLVAWEDALEEAFPRQSLGSPDVVVTIVSHPTVLFKANLVIVVTASHTQTVISSV